MEEERVLDKIAATEDEEGASYDFVCNGKILALPNFEDPFMSAQILWLRKDWLDKLSFGVPQTMDELPAVRESPYRLHDVF
ncbi:hypothetical protein WJ0W_003805 [Paenibacillus melissococcoides]|uniref:Uncharacterized protein n=1 Tax=Paenibacillus melissococcoides TaxID=2912268 RepID=A0ABM9G471_9BACL|nr:MULTISPECIES: hypothetical protein [Paenibacillus]MEB9897640.1 hypothetical protein [Bacillus cereus]CAH8246571.1 hypothetical protein WJ0W_003805 [Paenibacillus melissococcoides]CAH8715142.1 hypothetical protein HTL2_004176 [Paenibacillus melissococcoides]CAH8716074.1 hypothetical protein WDD9_004443 [Paenibacillus melissococcoides]GIO81702.1 hypothetical protein J6TS7_53120 [Paenibacillus dendritiformis]